MLNPSRLHFASALCGLLLGLLVLLCASQAAVTPTFPSGRFTFGPHPRDFVTIREGQPFVIPAGKVFVPTAVGRTLPGAAVQLVVDNTVEFYAAPIADGVMWTCSFFPVPGPMAFNAGQVVSIEDSDTSTTRARAWGYLGSESSSPSANPIYPRIEYSPRASDVVELRQGTSFTVPQGKVLVVTSIGRTTFGGGVIGVTVDGVLEISADLSFGGYSASVGPVPQGFAVPAGSVVLVTNTQGINGVAWGYLADV